MTGSSVSVQDEQKDGEVDFVGEMKLLLAQQKQKWEAFFERIPDPKQRSDLMHRLYLDGISQWFQSWKEAEQAGEPERAQVGGELYVNAKQYHRIMVRREERKRLAMRLVILQKKEGTEYMHESRSKHARKRKRAPDGRFLTKAELEVLDKQFKKTNANTDTDASAVNSNIDPALESRLTGPKSVI